MRPGPRAGARRSMHHAASRYGRIAAAVLLCALLAGCFTSSAPKFPLSTAVPALGEGGHYVAYERQDDGSYKRDETFTVRHRADGGYDFTDAKGKVTPLTLHRIRDNLYVAQATNEKNDHTDYVVLRVQDNEVLGYPVSCDKQDQAKMKALGVVIHDYECRIDGVADPAALFADLDLGIPGSKMVRE